MIVNPNEAPVVKEIPIVGKEPVTEQAKPPVVEDKKDELFSKRFSELAKQRRKFELDRKQAQQREADLAAREARLAEMEKKTAAPAKKKTPIEALMAEGYTYEDAAKFILNEGKIAPEDMYKDLESKVESRLEKYEREAEEHRQKQVELERRELEEAEQAQIVQVHSGIKALYLSKPEEYDLINQFDSEDEPMSQRIYALIETHWNSELERHEADPNSDKPRLMSYKDGCDLMEKYLEQEAERVFTNSKKLKAKYVLQQQQKNEDEQDQPSKTLSSAITTTSTQNPKGWISDEERNRRALAMLGD